MGVLWIIVGKEDGKVIKMGVLIGRLGKVFEGVEDEKEWVRLKIWEKSI